MTVSTTSRRTRLTRLAGVDVVLLAVGLACAALADVPLQRAVDPGVMAVVCALLFAVAEASKVHIEVRTLALSVSLSDFPLILGVFTVPAWLLLVAYVLGVGAVLVARRVEPHKIAVNVSLAVMEVGVAALVCTLLTRGQDDVWRWVAAAAAVLVIGALGVAAVVAAIALLQGVPTRKDVGSMLASIVVSGLLCAALGVMSVLAVEHGLPGLAPVAVVAVALVVAFRAYGRLLRDRRDQGAIFRAALQLSRAESPSELERALCAQAVELVGAERAAVLPAGAGLMVPGRGQDPLVIGAGTRDADAAGWLRVTATREALVVPLVIPGFAPRALVVRDRVGRTGTFNATDLDLLQTLVTYAATQGTNHALSGRLLHQAQHDPLTDLPNRAAFAASVERVLAQPPGDASCLTAVLLVDINRFKDINDILGHQIGDRLLTAVARTLGMALPRDAFLARVGSDEFAVLLPRAASQAEVETVAERLSEALVAPFSVSETVIHVSASVGLAGVFESGLDAPTLLRHLDVAVSAAKERRERFAWYAPEDDHVGAERLALAGDLRRAIERDDIDVHFQPLVSLADASVVGFEALARWTHPHRGPVPPDQFIPLADQTGQIGELTEQVVRKALAACSGWPGDVGVSVNLTARLLWDPTLVPRITGLVAAAAVAPARVTIELTEDTLIRITDEALEPLHRLRDHGLRISIDDFGTGYSSLAYLRSLPVHELKVDKAFVDGLEGSAAGAALMRSIVDICHVLGLVAVAEGVEDDAALGALGGMSCDVAQGYLVARPMPAAAVGPWLEEWNRTHRTPWAAHGG